MNSIAFVLAGGIFIALDLTKSAAHNLPMPKRSRKKPAKDFNQIAHSIVDQFTGTSTPKKNRPAKKAEKDRDSAAVSLGRKGGLKGGPARAAKLTKAELSESARKAARARWAAPLT